MVLTGLIAVLLLGADATPAPVIAPRPVYDGPIVVRGQVGHVPRTAPAESADTLGERLYRVGCASCHGTDGKGAPAERVAFTVPVPDFTECTFSTREPDADWAAIVHAGGPVRAFDATMPAFGEAFSPSEIQSILNYIRTFCRDARWPRGELNLPRAMFTEKAYPEDEAVVTFTVDTESPRGGHGVLVYEKRFGPRSQIELELPFAFQPADGVQDRATGIADAAVAIKHVLWHDLAKGGILSAGLEVVIPTGDRDRGLGGGTWAFEPFLSWGQMLPGDAFFQVQTVLEVPANRERGEEEAEVRAVFGRTFTTGAFGRAWTPMLEAVAARELEGGDVELDLVPQLQFTLNRRQHVIANVGVRLPVTETATRRSQLLLYVLWDWFDGGFFDGW